MRVPLFPPTSWKPELQGEARALAWKNAGGFGKSHGVQTTPREPFVNLKRKADMLDVFEEVAETARIDTRYMGINFNSVVHQLREQIKTSLSTEGLCDPECANLELHEIAVPDQAKQYLLRGVIIERLKSRILWESLAVSVEYVE
jgi:hypothetical protein